MTTTLTRVQAASGLIFFAFLIVHLGNTALAVAGPAAYDNLQAGLRLVYQQPVIESLLLVALLVHIVAGITRLVTERGRLLDRRGWWHRAAGLFLLVVIFGHIAAVRGPSLLLGISPGFAGLAFSIDLAPAVFYPYYFLLGLAGAWHGMNGARLALARWNVRIPALPVTLATAVWAAALAAALLGLGGVLYAIDDPRQSAFGVFALDLIGTIAP